MISTSLACGLLALPSLIHTLKDLPLPPMGSREWCVTLYPFDVSHCGLLALWAAASPTHLRIYPCHTKWEPSTWFVKMGQSHITKTLSRRRGNHQHHSKRANPHQKLTCYMCSKYIVYFQVVSQDVSITKYPQHSQSPQNHLLSKMFCINFPNYQNIFKFCK